MVDRETEWTIIFRSYDDSSRDPDYPEHGKWQPDRQASMEERERVLDTVPESGARLAAAGSFAGAPGQAGGLSGKHG